VVTPIQIELKVLLIKRALQDVVSVMTSWQSREQFSIAPRTAEAEYIVACSASYEVVWIRILLTYLFDLEMEATMILCDNQSCIEMMCSMMSRST
jgi:hypothetical protein